MSGLYLVDPRWSKVTAENLIKAGAEETTPWLHLDKVPEDQALVLLADNGPFMVAALLYDQEEWERWWHSMDTRRKVFYLMPKHVAHELAGYKE